LQWAGAGDPLHAALRLPRGETLLKHAVAPLLGMAADALISKAEMRLLLHSQLL